VTSPTPVPGLLQRITQHPGRPRLTWYGPAPERVELSGQVLDNWVTKSANLLVEEYEAGPGTHVLVDLPPHWRTVVWALAAWRTGACVVVHAPGATRGVAPGSVVVTADPQAWTDAAGHPDLVAVELDALARSFSGPLPAGATDAAAAVMTYGDVLTYMPETQAASPALALPDRAVPFAALSEWARQTVAATGSAWGEAVLTAEEQRALLPVATSDVALLLAATLVVLGADGSLVLLTPEIADDDARREQIATGERVTAGG
jgi:uncharacterized protein (TIGR03089 family)